jgi:hypothetical protein
MDSSAGRRKIQKYDQDSGRLFSEAEDDSDIGLPLLCIIGHGCGSAAEKRIAIDGLARGGMRGRPPGFGAHTPMRSEEIFYAAPEVVGEAITEVQYGLAIDGLNAVVRKAQAANHKRPQLSSWRKKLIEDVELIHVEIHVGHEGVGIVVGVVGAERGGLAIPHAFALEILPEGDAAHDAVVHAAFYFEIVNVPTTSSVG